MKANATSYTTLQSFNLLLPLSIHHGSTPGPLFKAEKSLPLSKWMGTELDLNFQWDPQRESLDKTLLKFDTFASKDKKKCPLSHKLWS